MRKAVALSCVGMFLVAACGGGGGATDDPASSTVESDSTAASEAADEPILIKTRMTLTPGKKIVSSGKVLEGTVGSEEFCPGGVVEDTHGATPDVALVDRIITCNDGTLKIGFSPQVPEGNTQRGPWLIVEGTGVYEGWQGSGEMKMVYDRGSRSTKGTETFTGIVVK